MDLCKINQGDFHDIITKERNKYLAYFQGEPRGLRNMEINFENIDILYHSNYCFFL